MNDSEIKVLEADFNEAYIKHQKIEKDTWTYRVGSSIALPLIIIYLIFDAEFYGFIGTFGVLLLHGFGGFFIIFGICSFLPGYKRDRDYLAGVMMEKKQKYNNAEKSIT